MEHLQSAYFAGLIDCEGYIRLQPRYDRPMKATLRATIELKLPCRASIEALSRSFGGYVLEKPGKRGFPTEWRWRVQDASARRVMRSIYPFLIAKRDAADALINYWRMSGRY